MRQSIPIWLLEGSQYYEQHRFLAGRNRQDYQNIRSRIVQAVADLAGPLSTFIDWDDAVAVEWRHRDLGVLATEWLIAHAGSDAPINFWRELPNHSGWRDAFSAAFEISVPTSTDATSPGAPMAFRRSQRATSRRDFRVGCLVLTPVQWRISGSTLAPRTREAVTACRPRPTPTADTPSICRPTVTCSRPRWTRGIAQSPAGSMAPGAI